MHIFSSQVPIPKALAKKLKHLQASQEGAAPIKLDISEIETLCVAYSPEDPALLINMIMPYVVLDVPYPVFLHKNFLFINHTKIKEYLSGKLDREIQRELTQCLFLIYLHADSECMRLSNGTQIETFNCFTTLIGMQKDIEKHLYNTEEFFTIIQDIHHLQDSLCKDYADAYENVLFQICKTVIGKQESNMVAKLNDIFYFNRYSFSQYRDNQHYKKECLRALYACENYPPEELHSPIIYTYRDQFLATLVRNVCEDDIIKALDFVDDKNAIDAIKELLLSNKHFFLPEKNYFNPHHIDYSSREQIMYYFIIQCIKNDASCLLHDGSALEMQKDGLYLEPLLYQKLTQISLEDIMQTIDSLQDKYIFSSIEPVIEHMIAEFSPNPANQKSLLINRSGAYFNRFVPLKNTLDLLEVFIYNMCAESMTRHRHHGLEYIEGIAEKILHLVEERDILNALDNIEKKSNFLIPQKDLIFHQASIRLRAKESQDIKNIIVELVSFKNSHVIQFNHVVFDEVMQKDLSATGARELIQAWFVSLSRNLDWGPIHIHDNFDKFNSSRVQEKLYGKITEADFDVYIGFLLKHIHFDPKDIISFLRNSIGIYASLKHLL